MKERTIFSVTLEMLFHEAIVIMKKIKNLFESIPVSDNRSGYHEKNIYSEIITCNYYSSRIHKDNECKKCNQMFRLS